MVGAVAFLPAAVVNDGGQVGEVSVQVEVLSVVPSDLGRCVSLTLLESSARQVRQLCKSSSLAPKPRRTDLSPVVVAAAVVALLSS